MRKIKFDIEKRREEIDKKYRPQIAGAPLRFGDRGQIALLRRWEAAIEELEREAEARSNPDAPLHEFEVTYRYYEEHTVTIEATCAAEAEEICEDDYGDEDGFDIDSVREVTKSRAA